MINLQSDLSHNILGNKKSSRTKRNYLKISCGPVLLSVRRIQLVSFLKQARHASEKVHQPIVFADSRGEGICIAGILGDDQEAEQRAF